MPRPSPDTQPVPDDPESQPQPTDPQPTGAIGWLRWLIRPPSNFGGQVVGLAFLWLSLTPSLLPRPWFAQAAASGIALTIGYGVGSGLSWLLHRIPQFQPSDRQRRTARWILATVAVLGTAIFLLQAKAWQNDLRRLMGIDDEPDTRILGLILLTAFVSGIVLLGARMVRSLTRFLIRQIDRVTPRPVSIALSVILATLLVVGFLQGFLWRGTISAMNSMAGTTNGTTTEGTTQPTSELRSGGPGSLVAWDDLGRMGRDFVGRGPSVPDLENFHQASCCEQPIRVYVGLDSADTPAERADLAVRELERTGAFERSVLGVFSATGTGWINPRVADSLEYLHRGDTAEVSMQYSFLPSWLSFLVDQRIAEQAGWELIGAVTRRLAQIPEDQQPRLLLFGESLGSFATEKAFDDIADLRSSTDGVLLVGPTFSNPIWRDLTDTRDAGSPQWLPRVDAEGVRFARRPEDLAGLREAPGSHVVFLQNSSDPITWWSRDLLYSAPDWTGPPDPPDRSPAFRWFPIVTFWQVVTDLTDSLGVPTGYGHHFGSNVADAWVAISAPPNWTDADTARLKATVGERG